MEWLVQLFREPSSVAHAVLILGLVAAIGLSIGTIRIFNINLGVAGVLFAGLAFGHFNLHIDERIMEFAREFGLILFVYTIGVQVGPGFVASLRKQGLPLNLMAAGIVVLGVITTLTVFYVFMDRTKDFPVAVGLFSGATTNTPSLAASRQALKDVLPAATSAEALKLPGLGYAVAYPFGIIGIIITMILVRYGFRINPQKEAELLAQLGGKGSPRLQTMNLEVKNPNLDGLRLSAIPTLGASGVVISRVMKGGRPQLALPETTLKLGDVLLAVGPRTALADLQLIVGQESKLDLESMPSQLAVHRILVTKSQALGKSVGELALRDRFHVNVTRVNRAEIELPVTPGIRLQFGDTLVVVGEEGAIKEVATELGDSVKQLNHPQVIPVFVGIALGVILGSWPIHIPGVPAPVKLGLAGGPLLVAIILSRLGNLGPLVWYMPSSANFVLRELGIVLFLACVGLNSGGSFVQTLRGSGMQWMFYGALITIVPLLVMALIARLVYKVNYLSLCGLLAGSMTDPPALAFASSLTGSDAPSVSYATVYPLVMLLRVLSAQAMVLFFYR